MLRDVVTGLVPPLVVAAALAALATRWSRARPAAGALALAAGALTGHLALLGWPRIPLVLDGWLVVVAALALVATTAERAGLGEQRPVTTHALRVVVAAVVGVMLLRARAPYWDPSQVWGAAALVALGVACSGALLDAVARRASPGWALATCCAVATGAAGAVLGGGSYRLALLAGGLAAALGAVWALRALDRTARTADVARGVAAALAPVLGAVVARNTVYGEQPATSAALLALAPGAAVVALLARERLGRAAEPLGLSLTVALAAAAAALAARIDEEGGAPY